MELNKKLQKKSNGSWRFCMRKKFQKSSKVRQLPIDRKKAQLYCEA